MNAKRASIIVPLYNDAASISACLDALFAQTCASACEIIVVDDGSTDDGPSRATAFPVRLIRQQNAGPAAARNVGARVAEGEILVFLDADCIAPTEWVERMLIHFANEQIGAVTGAIRSAEPHLMARLIQMEIDERYLKLAQSSTIDFFASVAVAIRRELFSHVGGFREDFRYNEDVELAYRLNAQAAKIVFFGDLRVAHYHPAGWKNYFWMKFWRGVWRMRLYKIFPQKAVSDSWTPQTLKFQTMAALAAFPALFLIPFYPSVGWVPVGLTLAILLSGSGFLTGALRSGGPLFVGYGSLFLLVRATALGAAVAWHTLTLRRWMGRAANA